MQTRESHFSDEETPVSPSNPPSAGSRSLVTFKALQYSTCAKRRHNAVVFKVRNSAFASGAQIALLKEEDFKGFGL